MADDDRTSPLRWQAPSRREPDAQGLDAGRLEKTPVQTGDAKMVETPAASSLSKLPLGPLKVAEPTGMASEATWQRRTASGPRCRTPVLLVGESRPIGSRAAPESRSRSTDRAVLDYCNMATLIAILSSE